MEGPRYPHDCQVCQYLGRFDTKERKYDLYYCYHPSRTDVELMARFGEGSDYYASDADLIARLILCREAKENSEYAKVMGTVLERMLHYGWAGLKTFKVKIIVEGS